MNVHSQGFTKHLAKMGGRVGREGEGVLTDSGLGDMGWPSPREAEL